MVDGAGGARGKSSGAVVSRRALLSAQIRIVCSRLEGEESSRTGLTLLVTINCRLYRVA